MKRIAFLAAAAALASCGWHSAELPSYNSIPPFTLTAHTGQEFDSRKELAGRVWVASFIFTNCKGPCPMMSARMQALQKEIGDLPGVRLVSFTVDPANDTPEILAGYAQRFHAESGRWFFLTGARETLHKLSRDAFMLGDVDASLEHSTRFVLVDREGVARGYYPSTDARELKKLLADIRSLVA